MKMKCFLAVVLIVLVCGMTFAQDSDTALRYQAYLQKANDLADQNDFAGAREKALKAIKLKSTDPEGWLTLGVIDHVGLNSNDVEALMAFRTYLKLSPTSKKKKIVQGYIGELENNLADQKEQQVAAQLKQQQQQATVQVEQEKKNQEKLAFSAMTDQQKKDQVKLIYSAMLDQKDRIQATVKSGQLSKDQARSLVMALKALQAQLTADSKNANGELTYDQVVQLKQMLEENSKNIDGVSP